MQNSNFSYCSFLTNYLIHTWTRERETAVPSVIKARAKHLLNELSAEPREMRAWEFFGKISEGVQQHIYYQRNYNILCCCIFASSVPRDEVTHVHMTR
jgi:hypothetical protein